MPHELFLSHDSRDKVRADVLAQAITRATLRQIVVWHSSDVSPTGGLQPGQVWLDEIRTRLSTCKAVVVLLTPTSVSRPWILFDSGFGAAHKACDVIPVCIGIDSATAVPFPLAMYQTYQLSDYESLKRFTSKLLAKYEIPFDEQMIKPVLEDAIKQITHAQTSESALPKQVELTLTDAVTEMKEHIDKRLMSLTTKSSNGITFSKHIDHRYNVSIDLHLGSNKQSIQFIEITNSMSLQRVLNAVYFMIKGEVGPNTYLEKWLLRDTETGERLVAREIQSRIPAKALFSPNSRWELVRLTEPYSPIKSNTAIPSDA